MSGVHGVENSGVKTDYPGWEAAHLRESVTWSGCLLLGVLSGPMTAPKGVGVRQCRGVGLPGAQVSLAVHGRGILRGRLVNWLVFF